MSVWSFNYRQFFRNYSIHQVVISSITVTFSERPYIRYALCHFLCVNMWSVIPPDVQVYLWMFRCGNVVLLTLRCWLRQSLLLQHHYRFHVNLFSAVGLKISSHPDFALACHKGTSLLYVGNSSNVDLIPHRNCPFNHHFVLGWGVFIHNNNIIDRPLSTVYSVQTLWILSAADVYKI
jgi:hypothetical protein